MKTRDGRLYVISGASRTGKTAWVARAVKGLPRVCAYDPEDQWSQLPGFKRVTTLKDLVAAVRTSGKLRVAYVASGDIKAKFDAWAQIVFLASCDHGGMALIAEELADVSTPAKAPEHWGALVRKGLKRSNDIFAISQRWAEADKTAFGNASDFIMFRQSSGDDVRYLARKTRVPEAEVDALATIFHPGTEDVKEAPYIHKNARTGETVRGKLTFSRR